MFIGWNYPAHKVFSKSAATLYVYEDWQRGTEETYIACDKKKKETTVYIYV